MKKFAVGYISFFENDLVVDFVDAENELLAILKHKEIKKQIDNGDNELKEWIEKFRNLENAKEEFFNGDMAIDVKEIV